MAKYSFQDIRIKGRSKKLKSKNSGVIKPTDEIKSLKQSDKVGGGGNVYAKLRGIPKNNNAKVGSRIVIWGIAMFAIIFLALSLFGLFSGAKIKVLPKKQNSVIDGVFKAVKEDSGEDKLSFQVMIVTAEENKKVSATEEKRVDKKASGTIIVYNSYSSSKQRLIKNTRFESPKGKVYKIKKSVTVPGTIVREGEIVPGAAEVIVYADEPGEDYNIGLTDFTIPGFKDNPRYKKFYARSKTEISGGSSGVIKVPSDSDLQKAKEELRVELRDKLFKETALQKPTGFVLYDNAKFIKYEDEINEEYSDNFVNLTLGAKLYGIIFSIEDFSKFIAEHSLALYDGNKVEIPELENLDFKIQNKESISPLDEDLRFSLSGRLSVIWTVDEGALKQKIAGTPKKEFENTMSKFPNITNAEASIRPFWRRSFPDKEKKIKVEVLDNK